jgi:N-acetylglucosamine-6-sulfatase
MRPRRCYGCHLLAGRVTIWGIVAVMLLLAAEGASANPSRQSNVVVIVTDDQDLGTYTDRFMPRTRRLLVDHGTDFTQAVVSTPQCCPSRAQLLTGQYAHNNGVTSNDPGYPLLRHKRSILPAWLRRAGYRTIHIGKFLNGYGESEGLKKAPGWDRWLTLAAASYSDPSFSINGSLRRYQRYLTGILSRMSVRAVKRYSPRRRPFYLQVDHYAPHVDPYAVDERCGAVTVPAPRDRDLFRDQAAPSGGS